MKSKHRRLPGLWHRTVIGPMSPMSPMSIMSIMLTRAHVSGTTLGALQTAAFNPPDDATDTALLISPFLGRPHGMRDFRSLTSGLTRAP